MQLNWYQRRQIDLQTNWNPFKLPPKKSSNLNLPLGVSKSTLRMRKAPREKLRAHWVQSIMPSNQPIHHRRYRTDLPRDRNSLKLPKAQSLIRVPFKAVDSIDHKWIPFSSNPRAKGSGAWSPETHHQYRQGPNCCWHEANRKATCQTSKSSWTEQCG